MGEINYDDLSIEELEAKRWAIMAQRDELAAKLKAVATAYDKKARMSEIERKLGGIDEMTLAALDEFVNKAKATDDKG